MPAGVCVLGIVSIILLLWVERVSDRLRQDEMLVDAIMDIQIHTGSAHLRIEEIVRSEPEVTAAVALAEVEQAIHLATVILDGGMAENDNWIDRPLDDPGLRAEAEDIRTLLVRFKEIGTDRMQHADGSGIDTEHSHVFHATFGNILGKARKLESIIEKDEAANQRSSRHLFIAIPVFWLLVVVLSTAGLWRLELHRKRAAEALAKVNEQLLARTAELTEHRENLAGLVDARTAELGAANEQLRAEVAERGKAEAALRESERQLRQLSVQLMTAQESERRNISKELHDELGHAMSILKLRVRSMERDLPDSPGLRADCEDILSYIDQTIDNIRRLSRDLSPSILEDLGLTEALRWLAENFHKSFDGVMTMNIEDIDHLFPPDSEIIIYRIMQEALTNIGKHAGACNVSVVVRKAEEKVEISIEDDGQGILLPQLSDAQPNEKGMGLTIMQERVRMLGGLFAIERRNESGTRVGFSIPVQKG